MLFKNYDFKAVVKLYDRPFRKSERFARSDQAKFLIGPLGC